jgi:transposase
MRLAKRIVQAIWHDLNDRKGIRHVLSDIEDDTPEIYKEIQDDLNKLVYAVLTQGGKETYAISELGLLRVKTYREGDHLVIGLKCPCCTIRQEFIGEYTKNIYGPGEPKRVVAYCTVCGYEACVTATLDPEEE